MFGKGNRNQCGNGNGNKRGVKCTTLKCPACTSLVREELLHTQGSVIQA